MADGRALAYVSLKIFFGALVSVSGDSGGR
jgi:hypothetical protein